MRALSGLKEVPFSAITQDHISAVRWKEGPLEMKCTAKLHNRDIQERYSTGTSVTTIMQSMPPKLPLVPEYSNVKVPTTMHGVHSKHVAADWLGLFSYPH